MNIGWHDLLTALALLLIMEGLMPFASPASMKRAYEQFLSYPEKTLRIIGLVSIIAGILLLFLVD